PDGQQLSSIGRAQNVDLDQPIDVAARPDGGLVVVDRAGASLVWFDRDNKETARAELPGADSVEGAHLAAGADGAVYVSDPPGHRLLHFDRDAKLVEELDAAGAFRLAKPVGLALDGQPSLYVADSGAHQILRIWPAP